MKFSHPQADIFVPDSIDPQAALARVTHLCIGAHQDDIEIMAHAGIVDCLETPGKWFGGVVVTNGAGSPRTGKFANFTDAHMQHVRRDAQRAAARLGRYSLQLQLAHPSSAVKQNNTVVPDDLLQIFQACRPEIVYLHNPFDKHDTHIAVLQHCLTALRRLPPAQRPARVLGCEVWRDLDWLPDELKVALDAGRRPELAEAMLKVFDSQISGGKRYDLATQGRRLANATFSTPRAADHFSGITWAVDMTSLIQEPFETLEAFASRHLDLLRTDITNRIKRNAAL